MKRLMVLVIGFMFLICTSAMAAEKPAAATAEPLKAEEKAPAKKEKKAKKVKKVKKVKKEKKEDAAPAEKPAK